jgi:hypothetical protein
MQFLPQTRPIDSALLRVENDFMKGVHTVNGHSIPDYSVQGGFPGQVFCLHCGFVWPNKKCPEDHSSVEKSILYQFLKDNKTQI